MSPEQLRNSAVDDTELADLLTVLRTIRDADAELDSVDNEVVGLRLGWTADLTADRLGAARDRLLIWGVRVGGRPGPCFVDLELTVQGRRALAAADTEPQLGPT